MVNVIHNKQMSVYTATCIVNSHISYSTNSVHILIKVAHCTIRDNDQCKIAGVFYAKMLVIRG